MYIMFSQTWLSLQVSKTLDSYNFQINLGGTGTPLLLTAQGFIHDSNESHYMVHIFMWLEGETNPYSSDFANSA